MPKLFEEHGVFSSVKVLPYDQCIPCRDLGPRIRGWEKTKLRSPWAVEQAEKLLEQPIPALPATLFMEYYRNGNRNRYQKPYFTRRNNAFLLALAELTEGNGRFTDLLVDYVWAILEEATWIIPAHDQPNHGNPKNCLSDAITASGEEDCHFIDLFSAGTGAVLAWIWYLLDEVLDRITPAIRIRIRGLLERRILRPYRIYSDGMWWVGANGGTLNNWTPWIVSNILPVVMLCEEDQTRREEAVVKSMTILDRFTSFYPADGGCDEGPGYWNVAAASYFDCLEVLWDLTDGTVDIFTDPLVRRMGEYIADFNLTGNTYVNFADASHLLTQDLAMITRYGRRCGSEKLTAFAAEKLNRQRFFQFNGTCGYRTIRNLLEEPPEPVTLPGADNIFYDGLEVFISKNKTTGLSLAFKGGTNGESHNHNDVGNFILFRGEVPVFLDPGVETYSKKTFSSERYTLWTMRSLYHNLPMIHGYEQRAGRLYHGEVVSYTGDTLTLELKDAYPTEAGIVSYRRSVQLTDTEAVIRDNITLREEGGAVFTLMTKDLPDRVTDHGFHLSEANCTAEFDPTLTYSAEAVPLDDPKLHQEWSTDALTRILLTSKPFSEKEFVLTITAE